MVSLLMFLRIFLVVAANAIGHGCLLAPQRDGALSIVEVIAHMYNRPARPTCMLRSRKRVRQVATTEILIESWLHSLAPSSSYSGALTMETRYC